MPAGGDPRVGGRAATGRHDTRPAEMFLRPCRAWALLLATTCYRAAAAWQQRPVAGGPGSLLVEDTHAAKTATLPSVSVTAASVAAPVLGLLAPPGRPAQTTTITGRGSCTRRMNRRGISCSASAEPSGLRSMDQVWAWPASGTGARAQRLVS
jgi:hypothetical protein